MKRYRYPKYFESKIPYKVIQLHRSGKVSFWLTRLRPQKKLASQLVDPEWEFLNAEKYYLDVDIFLFDYKPEKYKEYPDVMRYFEHIAQNLSRQSGYRLTLYNEVKEIKYGNNTLNAIGELNKK